MQIPIVFVDRKFEGMTGPFIGADNAGGAARAAQLLHDRGHRQIGVISGPASLSTMSERLHGFRQQLAAGGVDLPDDWVTQTPTRIEDGKQAAQQLLTLDDRPTALFANNYFHSLGALLAIKESGLRCPQDIALIGFDDHPWAAVSSPPLTVIRQPGRKMGYAAAETLLKMIRGEVVLDTKQIFECELVLRNSV
jgi:DNA-binding LacI/PurR family transcriptional regulator